MRDLAVVWVNGAGDISIDGHDFEVDDSLTTAVIISLFTDRAVPEDELEEGMQNQGWWGDSYSDEPWGSKLWLLRRQKSTDDVASDAEDYAYEALEWLVNDNLIDSLVVNASRESSTKSAVKDMLVLSIELSPTSGEPQRELKINIEEAFYGL
ncbi:phage GP46 family protein [Ignatzschineria cameli]|uniref:Mu-like prophage protein gp46 n=1 Tax=Ignatzschineria cameli TaxID=2182793 RepID=A0ABX5L0J0_9GAMM|nr:phage GP46 family protein [Ignatzschineria cameli]PWD90336.1 hypothetical protein DC079_04130 [Ignatzschineria cameli]PWD92219.1 hypothetical protein DC081_03835 [Ignatzschineria cameli]PWD93013.1 hypothetical protein DC078_04130 [Ignatzschineria cameli]